MKCGEALAELSHRQLVGKALTGRDEPVFQARSPICRHGLSRLLVLPDSQDSEDAFQATFVIPAQKLRTARKQESLASGVYGVAQRVALKPHLGNAVENHAELVGRKRLGQVVHRSETHPRQSPQRTPSAWLWRKRSCMAVARPIGFGKPSR
jgi:hypothetical protein